MRLVDIETDKAGYFRQKQQMKTQSRHGRLLRKALADGYSDVELD